MTGLIGSMLSMVEAALWVVSILVMKPPMDRWLVPRKRSRAHRDTAIFDDGGPARTSALPMLGRGGDACLFSEARRSFERQLSDIICKCLLAGHQCALRSTA